MNKQEFLAMSLPYGLIIEVENNYDNDVKYWQLKPTYLDRDCICTNKLILRPLSDLTKEIEHKGEDIYPIGAICQKYRRIYPLQLIAAIQSGSIDLNIAIDLIKWHFDIAGLIEKGEAIDVNTLEENPYK